MKSKTGSMSRSKMLIIAIALVVGIISVLIRPVLSSVDTYSHQINQLEEKRNTVMALTAASSVTSALISAIPDDTATPIADQLADYSNVFIVILSVLVAEKYLLTVFGSFAMILVLFACITTIIYNIGYNKAWLYSFIIKLLVLAVAIGTLIPMSIKVSDMIETTFEYSINNVITEALDSEEELKSDEEDVIDEGLWQKFTKLFTYVGDKVSEAVASAGRLVEKAKTALGHFVEAIAVTFVTSCVIPMVVLLLYIIIIKYVFGLSFQVESVAKGILHRKKKPQQNVRHQFQ